MFGSEKTNRSSFVQCQLQIVRFGFRKANAPWVPRGRFAKRRTRPSNLHLEVVLLVVMMVVVVVHLEHAGVAAQEQRDALAAARAGPKRTWARRRPRSGGDR